MARCPDCNKFVSYDDSYEPEVESAEVSDSTLTIEVRVVLPCAECGTELKESTMEASVEIEHDCSKKDEDGFKPEFSVDESDISAEMTSNVLTTKKVFLKRTEEWVEREIKNRRGWKQMYGAYLTGHVVCENCGEKIEFDADVEEQASSFDDLT